ncbi:MAG: peptidylprolyl isomerase [Verrucomicrobiota bacterium]
MDRITILNEMSGSFRLAMLAILLVEFGGLLHAQKPTDGIAAVVNQRVITFSEILGEIQPLERQYRELYSGLELVNKLREARLNSLKSLVERELIIDEFKSKGFFFPENVIDDDIRRHIDERYEGDRRAFIRTLQANGISLSNFKERQLEDRIVMAMRAKEVQQAVIISPYQIEQYYQDNVKDFVRPDQVRLRMIYMKKGLFKETREGQDGETVEVDPQRLIMEEILRKVKTGSDFANLAQSYSESPQRTNGGDMGWVSDKTLRTDLSEVAFSLRPGQNSELVETEDGYYILLAEDIRKATVVSLDDVRESIENTLLQQERERLQQEWLDSLRAKAFIKMFF